MEGIIGTGVCVHLAFSKLEPSAAEISDESAPFLMLNARSLKSLEKVTVDPVGLAVGILIFVA